MISFKQLREKCWSGYHAVGVKKKNGRMVPNCVPKENVEEDAPANAVGDGSGVALPPAVEPGVNVKKKKKDPILGLLKREDYNRVEVENVINKITTSQDVEENQIKPILNNIAKKKEKGTYTEQFGHAAMRYVVDQQTDLPEEQKDEIATSLLARYE